MNSFFLYNFFFFLNQLSRYELSEKMLSACYVLKTHLSDTKALSSKDVVSGGKNLPAHLTELNII